jgi:hypothetical protein
MSKRPPAEGEAGQSTVAEPSETTTAWLPILALVVGVGAWLWPIGFGGRMPVGGDVTQFAIGLMAFLSQALRAGRWPVWNDLWGYGFPGLAESQMGVYYPPHWLLYGWLSVEGAYTASLVAHTLWAALGASWAARRFGVSPWGAALAGFSWATCGFYLIHLPHHWAATTGSWMPWAWGLAWMSLRGQGRHSRWAPWALAVVLTLQVLPGHFQLGFITQVSVLAMSLAALTERRAGDGRRPRPRPPRPWRAVGAVGLALASVPLLAAAQLGPTYRLARLAASSRDFEYLSGFAATPWHLVSYVAPGLFHRSPLWRPVAWDPFHTSPEEHLGYIGLVPLFLALGAIGSGLRGPRDPAARMLTILAILMLVLSLGPYVLGFALWSRWPGFSFFRAPARWGVGTMLALALLAGRGFDTWRSWRRPRRAWIAFVTLAALAPLVLVFGFELALASTSARGWPAVAGAFGWALRQLPWRGDPSFVEVMRLARQPPTQDLVIAGLMRRGIDPAATGARLSRDRFSIYAQELGPTAALLVAMLALAPLTGRPRLFRAWMLGLTAVDLGFWGHADRPVDLAPIRPLTAQSPVLARLAREPRGTRTIDPLRNLPMIAAAAPVAAYRTLDLPVLERLTALAQHPAGGAKVRAAMRATGARVRVFFPADDRPIRPGTPRETITDPALASWLFGAAWVGTVRGARLARFTVWKSPQQAAKAWLLPGETGRSAAWRAADTGDPDRVLKLLDRAVALESRSPVPERMEIEVPAEGPGTVVISQLADPQWRASWIGPAGAQAATIARAFGGWQGVTVPGRGRWTLVLEYEARAERIGLIVSALAWSAGFVAFWWRRRSALRLSEHGRQETKADSHRA